MLNEEKREPDLQTGVPQDSMDSVGGDGDQTAGGIEKIDMEEAERIAAKREEQASRSALKSYFEQQGLSEEQVGQALEAYKAKQAEAQAAARNDLTQLQVQYDALVQEKQTIAAQAQLRLVQSEAMMQALSMQIRPDRVEHVIRLADLTTVGVDANGKPDEAAIIAALEAVVNITPEFRATAGAEGEEKLGFKIGASDKQQKMKDAEIAKIFKVD